MSEFIPMGGTGDSQLEYALLATRKTVEILQAQVQLLTSRVEGLERYIVSLQQHQQQQQQQQQQAAAMYGVPQQQTQQPMQSGGTPANGITSPVYYWPPGGALGPVDESKGNNNVMLPQQQGSPSSAGAKQLEDDLQRLGIQTAQVHTPTMTAATLNAQQQQLAVVMAQHQRDEAIVAMLNGQSSPIVTPTANVGQMFPTAAPGTSALNAEGVMMYNNGGNANNNMMGGGGYTMYQTLAPTAAATSSFAALPTTVTIDPGRGTNEMLERACQQHWLKEVCLKGCKNVSNLTPLARLKNLWKLNLQGCVQHVDDNAIKLISTYNKRLSRLNLCGCERITDATPLSQLAFLFDLNLSGCQIGNDSIEAISACCSQLSRLAINSCPQVTSISSVGQLRELKLLYCRYSGNISPSSITDVLHAIGGNLLTLNVDGIKFSELDLSRMPAATALKNLNMKDNTELKNLDWLLRKPSGEGVFSSLEMLDVEGCTSLAQLGNVVGRLPSLRFLRLSRTSITQDELNHLASAPALSAVYIEGCQHIHNVACLTQVKQLSKLMVDAQLQYQQTPNGLDAIYARGGVEVIFSTHTNNNNTNNNNISNSPLGSPTTGLAPTMPIV